ncbi:MAG: Hsp70 family protein [Acidimicrobiales bacterium]|jgi:actin-like ATPase involved in cell morphogenesis|nr:Hsp70 family protein [Acidimicrobiales bacterium]
MAYFLGIDLGTTYTAAAIHRGDASEMVQLGSSATSVPTVVYLDGDGTCLVGEPAARRSLADPSRVAREFKRRIGDPTPLLLGGSPVSTESVLSRVLQWVHRAVCERQGEVPQGVAVTHPANWGRYKTDLLKQAIRMAQLPDALLVTEPEAAALSYAMATRIAPGEVVGVFDLGGGTFDAVVLQSSDRGFVVLGAPEGIERLGGIDVDAAVFAHVDRVLGAPIAALDRADPAAVAAVSRLRDECREAKEVLSVDTEVVVPVALPGLHQQVRLTRSELEQMLRPMLGDAVAAMRRAVTSTGLSDDRVSRILLVGGSSRIPLVAELLSAEFGRPIALDAHPKNVVAIGAALAASGVVASSAQPPTRIVPTLPQGSPKPPAEPATPSPGAARTPPRPPAARPTVRLSAPTAGLPPTPGQATVPPGHRSVPVPVPAGSGDGPSQGPPVGAAPVGARTEPPARPAAAAPKEVSAGPPRGLKVAVVVAAVVFVLTAAAAVWVALTGGSGDGAGPDATLASSDSLPGACADREGDYICITEIVRSGNDLEVRFVSTVPLTLDELDGELVEGTHHAHFFFNTVPAGQAGVPGTGPWELHGSTDPFTAFAESDIPPFATAVCVLVANADHTVIPGTGNCEAIPAG